MAENFIKMPKVVIESPYRATDGDHPIFGVVTNLKYLDHCLRDSILRGEAPFASHVIYTRVLDDQVPEQRDMGIHAGFNWYMSADRMAVYTDRGISEGMRRGIKLAEELELDIEFRELGKDWLDG